MILTFESTAPAYNGKVEGSVILRSGTRGVARTRFRPANSRQRQRWVPPWSFRSAAIAWGNLSEEVQDDWNETAAAAEIWPIQGSPRITDGKTFFENYLTVLLLIDPAAAVPNPPPDEPEWQTLPQWFEFAEWIADRYTLKAETEFQEDTHLIFSGLPPSPSVFNGEWFGEQIIGNNAFTSGLLPDEEWDGIHDMIETAFGPINDTMKIWGRVWEVYPATGFIRVLKDPCTPDPTTEIPYTTAPYGIYNNHDAEMASSYIAFTNGSEAVGYIYWDNTPAYTTESGTFDFLEGFDSSDVTYAAIHAQWDDGELGFWAYYGPWSWNPFNFTVYPNQ